MAQAGACRNGQFSTRRGVSSEPIFSPLAVDGPHLAMQALLFRALPWEPMAGCRRTILADLYPSTADQRRGRVTRAPAYTVWKAGPAIEGARDHG